MKEKIYNLLKQETSKYVYFFLTITGSFIAFLVKIILYEKLVPNYELLLLTIVLLGLSFFSGWRNILLYMQKLSYEFAIEDTGEKATNSDIKIKIKDGVYRRLDKNEKKLKCCKNCQFIFFILGMLFFILWLAIKAFSLNSG